MNTEPSSELHALLDEKLDTFEKLELVLALHTAGKPLTVAELAFQLQVGREVLRRVADEIIASGVIEMVDDDAVRLKPGSWDPHIAEAADIYTTEPTKLMKILSRIAMAKLRGMAARTFADAFRIRRKGD